MTKFIKIFLAVITVALLAIAFFAATQGKSLAENAIKKYLESNNIVGEAKINSWSTSNANLSINLIAPFVTKIESLDIDWIVHNLFSTLPTKIDIHLSIGGKPVNIRNEVYDLNLKNLKIKGEYSQSNFIFESIQANVAIDRPIKSSIELRTTNPSAPIDFKIVFDSQIIKIFPQVKNLKIVKAFSGSGTLQLSSNSQSINFISDKIISLQGILASQPINISLNKFKGKFLFSDVFDYKIDDLSSNIQGDFAGINFNSPVHIKNLTKNSGDIDFNLESILKGKSYSKLLKQFSLDFVEVPSGSLKTQGRVTRHKKYWEILASNIIRVDSLKLYAIPIKKLSIDSEILCLFKEIPSCSPKNGQHKVSFLEAGETHPIKNLSFLADIKDKTINATLNASWLGSLIESKDFAGEIDYPKIDIATKLRVESIELQKLSKMINMKNLDAEGKMQGHLNLKYSAAKGLVILPSILRSLKPGVLHYKDPSVMNLPNKIDTLKQFNALLAQGQQALVYKALDNFHYKEMEIEAKRPEPGKLSLKLHLDGSNPDLANGQIFDITIPVEGSLESLLAESSFEKLAESKTSEEYIRRLRKAIAK